MHSYFILLCHLLFYTFKKYEIQFYKFSRYITKKIKLSHSRPGQVLRAAGISRHSEHEGGKVVSPTHRPSLPTRRYPCYLFLLVGQEEFTQWNSPMTTSAIETATFRLVAQCLNQMRHRVSPR